jgi:hypothetical protein
VAPKTLRAYCRDELDNGATVANVAVGRFLYDQATGKHGKGGPAVAAAIFWAKTRMGWKETIAHEHIGKGGADITLRVTAARARNLELIDAVAKRVIDRVAGVAAASGADPQTPQSSGHA